jgi:hypothetical protein
MTLHLARSDGREGRWGKGDDQMMLAIVLIRIVDQAIMSRWKGKVQDLPTDQLLRLLGFNPGEGKKKQQHKEKPFKESLDFHRGLLSISLSLCIN